MQDPCIKDQRIVFQFHHRKLWKSRDSLPYFGSELWSQFDSLMKSGNYPWYIWNVHFKKKDLRQIKVTYFLPCGKGYGDRYRYFKYLLHTGAGWYGKIDTAKINIQIMDFSLAKIDSVSPSNYYKDKKENTYRWLFTDLEPTEKDDIYLEYSFGWKKFKYWYYKKFRYYINPRVWISRHKYKQQNKNNAS